MDNRQTIIDDFESIIVLAHVKFLATLKFKRNIRGMCAASFRLT